MSKALSCKTIVGTSVIEIEQGIGLGSVQQVVVDQGVSLTFIIKTAGETDTYALLPSSQIYGIGNYAAMIQNQSVLKTITEAELNDLLEHQGAIMEELVITIEGDKVGKVTDFYVDHTHEIGYLLVESDTGNNLQIDKDQLQMIGKEFIILNTSVKDNFSDVIDQGDRFTEENFFDFNPIMEVDSSEDLLLKEEIEKEIISTTHLEFEADKAVNLGMEQIDDIPVMDTTQDTTIDLLDFLPKQSLKTIETVEDSVKEEPEVVSYQQQQKSLLVGQRTSSDLLDDDGLVLVAADTVITDSMINLLRKIDRKLLVKLAGCVVDERGY